MEAAIERLQRIMAEFASLKRELQIEVDVAVSLLQQCLDRDEA